MAFLAGIVAKQPKGREIHTIVDNLSAHKSRRRRQFLEGHPPLHMHFTPAYGECCDALLVPVIAGGTP